MTVCYNICSTILGVLQMQISQETKTTVAHILNSIFPYLDEKQKRTVAANVADILGYGGITFVNEVTGVSRPTIYSGIEEIKAPSTEPDEMRPSPSRIRRPGGGRKSAQEKNPFLYNAINEIVDSSTYGDPEKPLRWTTWSLRKIADELLKKGIEVSRNVVARALDELGYSKQQDQKMYQVGCQHPDRNAQFEFINETAGKFLKEGDPVISVDAKKKENIGNFKNAGAEYRPRKQPRKVLDHDLPLPELGKVSPYGVYVLNDNTGFVNLGTSHDTPEFAGESVLLWWKLIGQNSFTNSSKIYITCDGGGSNGSRVWLWKYYIQKMSNETGLEIHVSHFPPGTSKWNKIEHRLFCYISKNWQGQALVDIETVVSLIGATTTEEGLTVTCTVDENIYETGHKITEAQKANLNIEYVGPNEKWNYIIRPNV